MHSPNRAFEQCVALTFIDWVRRSRALIATTIWRSTRSRPPFRPSTVPTCAGIFPTDFSSTMPSADCPSATARLATRSRQVASSVLCSLSGSRSSVWLTVPRRGLGKPVASLRHSYSQSLGLSRGTPDYFQCVTVKSTAWAAASLKRLVTGTSDCVAPSSHIQTAYTYLRGVSPPVYSVRSAHTFASGFLKAPLRTKPLPPATLRRYLAGFRTLI